MTQLESAREGVVTPEMVRVAIRENVTPEFVRDCVARGTVVIPANVRHLAGSGGQPPSRNAELGMQNAEIPPAGGNGVGAAAIQNPKSKIQNHVATEGGRYGATSGTEPRRYGAAVGHPTYTPESTYWVNQTVSQRRAWLNDAGHCRGEIAPKRLDPTGIGRPITTKINANQGASPVSSDTKEELDKLRHAIAYGADTVMDLSTGGRLDECRQAIIDNSVVPVGTVPIYSMILERAGGPSAPKSSPSPSPSLEGRGVDPHSRSGNLKSKPIQDLTYDDILREVEHQAKQGVDYFTIHAGVLKEHLPLIKNRITGLVSRGGSLLAKWMIHHNKQNPMYDMFDEISAIMRQYDVTYSLGDGVRPGCLADASDPAQIAELHVLGELVHRAREAGVQVMVEGPGHVPLNEIAWNMEHQRTVCDDAPFYVLGPLVTDVFPGYDHITSAIGATEAARAGAAMLCYVTPKEHVGLPKAEDVKAGCIAYKIAAHAGDIARGVRGARRWDDDLSKARAALNWPLHFELAFDGETARALHDEDLDVDTDFCAMCGHDWCSMRISKEIQEWASGKADGFVPLKVSARSPGLTPEQISLLAHRGKKHDCHSDNIADAEAARHVQVEYVRSAARTK